jgi:hypothetical protein
MWGRELAAICVEIPYDICKIIAKYLSLQLELVSESDRRPDRRMLSLTWCYQPSPVDLFYQISFNDLSGNMLINDNRLTGANQRRRLKKWSFYNEIVLPYDIANKHPGIHFIRLTCYGSLKDPTPHAIYEWVAKPEHFAYRSRLPLLPFHEQTDLSLPFTIF